MNVTNKRVRREFVRLYVQLLMLLTPALILFTVALTVGNTSDPTIAAIGIAYSYGLAV